MLFAIGFIFTFINGGLTGLFLGNVAVDVPLSDTMFVVAHFHMVMAVAPILVVFGAIYHWYPKITGRMLNETLGKMHFWVTFLGAYAIFFPMHYLGLLGVPRRYYELGETAFIPASAQTLNAFITIAALIVGAAQLVFLFNLVWSSSGAEPAGGNPGARPRWSGRRRTRRRGTATGARSCRWSIAGPTTTACRAPPRTSSRRTSRRRRRTAEAARTMAITAAIPGRHRGDCRLVAVRQRSTSKPWLEQGAIGDPSGGATPHARTAEVGLGVFLAVVGSLFALLVSAYTMRMHMGADWRPLPVPPLLWLNTGVLVAQQRGAALGAGAARRGAMRRAENRACSRGGRARPRVPGGPAPGLAAARPPPATSLAANPANRFFYLLTALHGLHLLGGLVALARTTAQGWRGVDIRRRVRLSVELCAIYWHFLLVVWLVLVRAAAAST